jgi:hypothetical protein
MSDHVEFIQGHSSSSDLIQAHLMSPIVVTHPDQIIESKNENTKLFLPMEQRRRLALMILAGKNSKNVPPNLKKSTENDSVDVDITD